MSEKISDKTRGIMNERFGKDSLIAVATASGGKPFVRTVNAYYEDGCFYIVTYALSNKMLHIKENPSVAVCGDWFTAQGIGENMGYCLKEENRALTEKLREVFREWYYNGHTDESDPNTCILRIRLTEGVIFSGGVRYDIEF